MNRAVFYRPLLFGVIGWVLVLSIFLGPGAWFSYKNYLFADHGQRITGKVLKKYTTVSQGKHGPTTTYHIAYQYQVGNLQVTRHVEAHGSTWWEFADGGTIPVKYLPEKITDSRIDNYSENRLVTLTAGLLVGVGLLILVFGSIVLYVTLQWNQRFARLLATGLTCMGQVTSLETEKAGKVQVVYLIFEFTDNQGSLVQARTGALNRKQERYWEPKRPIKVIYDSRNPTLMTVDLNSAHYDGRPQIGTGERGAPWLGSVR